jgi:hypothetical protein
VPAVLAFCKLLVMLALQAADLVLQQRQEMLFQIQAERVVVMLTLAVEQITLQYRLVVVQAQHQMEVLVAGGTDFLVQ